MLITYLVILILAILFRTFHFPFVSLLFLTSILFPVLDLIVQLIKKRADKETRIWSAVCVVFWSFFLLFKFLYWPGSALLIIPAALFTLIYLIRVFQKKHTINYRFYVVIIITLFSIINFSMKQSTFRMFYMTEDPFSKEQQVPHFFRQKLAFSFYNEGEFDKAEQLIQLNIAHLERLLVQENAEDFEKETDQKNLEQSQLDLEMIQKRSWDIFIPLIRDDRAE